VKKEIYKLDDYFKDLLFFKNLTKDTDKETCYHCFRVMEYQHYKAGEIIFRYGKIFVILNKYR
jgi:hypothetical protein